MTTPLRIDRVRLHHLEIPLRAPFRTSAGEWTHKRAVIVELSAGGLTGYGELVAPEAPFYTYETQEISADVIRRYLAPALMDTKIGEPADVSRACSRVSGYPMAKAALETAVWDLVGRRDGRSLAEMIGGTRDRVAGGVALGIEPDLDASLRRLAPFVEAGYRRVKLKVKPGWDETLVTAVAEAFPDLVITVDGNGAYRREHADRLVALSEGAASMIEQPYPADDLVGHAELAARASGLVALDESLTSAAVGESAARLSERLMFNVKVGRVGGLDEALRIYRRAHADGRPLWVGGMFETCIGRLVNLALGSLAGFTRGGDVSGSDRYHDADLVDPPIRLEPDGRLRVPRGPGIGATVRADEIRRFTIRDEVLEP